MDHHSAYLAVKAAYPEFIAAWDQIGYDTAEASTRLQDLLDQGLDVAAELARQERDRNTEREMDKQYFAALDTLGIRLTDHEEQLTMSEQ